jgi:hypothetical protein
MRRRCATHLCVGVGAGQHLPSFMPVKVANARLRHEGDRFLRRVRGWKRQGGGRPEAQLDTARFA